MEQMSVKVRHSELTSPAQAFKLNFIVFVPALVYARASPVTLPMPIVLANYNAGVSIDVGVNF